MKFMTIPSCQGLAYSFILAFCTGCSKENYLEVGKDAIVIESQGMLIRGRPAPNGKKIILVPFGNAVRVLSEGAYEKLYGIKSKWYRVSYGRYEGWMWGGFSKSNAAKADTKEGPMHDPIDAQVMHDLSDSTPKPKIPPEEQLVLAWESRNEYCTELYASPYSTAADAQWIKSAYQDRALRTDRVTILPKCIEWRARSIILINPLKNPPKSDSEAMRIMQKFTIVSYDYSSERKTPNEEYLRLFSSRGADVEVIK